MPYEEKYVESTVVRAGGCVIARNPVGSRGDESGWRSGSKLSDYQNLQAVAGLLVKFRRRDTRLFELRHADGREFPKRVVAGTGTGRKHVSHAPVAVCP